MQHQDTSFNYQNNRQVPAQTSPQMAQLGGISNRDELLGDASEALKHSFNSCPSVGAQNEARAPGTASAMMAAGQQPDHDHLLQIIDQTDDNESLLQALEGLTLDSSYEASLADSHKRELDSQSGPDKENKGVIDTDPVGEHGKRSEFIKDVADRLIDRVSSEAGGDLNQARQLMQQYLFEFCGEYDRCGYSVKQASATDGQSDQSKYLTNNQQSLSSRTTNLSSSTRPSQQQSKKSSDKTQSQSQMAFDNQILKKGVRVLSKNLQRANDQNRVKDQQLRVMRNIVIHQKNQLSTLQANQTSTTHQASSLDTLSQQQHQQQNISSVESRPSPTQLTGIFNSLQDSIQFPNQPDSSMTTAHDQLVSQPPNAPQQASQTLDSSNAAAAPQRAPMLDRSLHLQSMRAMQGNFRHSNPNPDIY